MSERNRRNNFLIQGSILAATSLIVRIIGLVYRIPMNRIIGDDGVGIYSNTFEIYNFALILSSYSLPIAVSRLVAIRRVNKEYKNSYRIFICALSFAVIVGLAAMLIVFIFAENFSKLIINGDSAVLPLRVLAPTIFIFAIMGVLRGFFQGKNTMIPTAMSQLIEQVVNAIVSIAAAYIFVSSFSASVDVASYGAAGGTMGTLIGALMGLLFLVFIFMIYRPALRKQMRRDKDEYRESYVTIFKLLLITVAPIILSQTVFQISGILDISIFNHIMAPKEVSIFDREVLQHYKNGETYLLGYRDALLGIYGFKYKLLSNVPVAIATAISTTIVTTIAAAYSKGLKDVIHSKIHAAIKFNMIIAIPSAVGMGVLASPILQLIFKERHQLPANLLMLGSIAIVFFALSTLSSAVLQGINRLRIPVINSAISLGIHVVFLMVLLRFTSLSTYALVMGNVTFALVVCILNWLAIEKYLDYHQEILKTFLIPAISSGFMGIVTYFTYKGMMSLVHSNTIAIIIAIIAAIIVYFAFLIFLKGIEEKELEAVPKGATIVRILKKIHML